MPDPNADGLAAMFERPRMKLARRSCFMCNQDVVRRPHLDPSHDDYVHVDGTVLCSHNSICEHWIQEEKR